MRKPLLKALIIFSLILTVFTACDHNVYMGEPERITPSLWKVNNTYFDSLQEAMDYIYGNTKGNSKSKSITDIPLSRTAILQRDVLHSNGETGGGLVVPEDFTGQLVIDFNGFTYEFDNSLDHFFDVRGGDEVYIFNGTTVIYNEADHEPYALAVNTDTVTIDEHLIDDRRWDPTNNVSDAKLFDVGEKGKLRVVGIQETDAARLTGVVSVFTDGKSGGKLILEDSRVVITNILTRYKNPETGAISDSITLTTIPADARSEITISSGYVTINNIETLSDYYRKEGSAPAELYSKAILNIFSDDATNLTKIENPHDSTEKPIDTAIQTIIDDQNSVTDPDVEHVIIHSFDDEHTHAAVDPTCTTAGNILYYQCTTCHKYFDSDLSEIEDIDKTVSEGGTIIPAFGHTLLHVEAKEETCTEDGNTEYWKCTVCEKLFSDENGTTETNIDSVIINNFDGHAWGAWTTVTSATCETEGLKKHVCLRCGQEETDTIEALGHLPNPITKDDYLYNETHHWVICQRDSSHTFNYGEHDWGDIELCDDGHHQIVRCKTCKATRNVDAQDYVYKVGVFEIQLPTFIPNAPCGDMIVTNSGSVYTVTYRLHVNAERPTGVICRYYHNGKYSSALSPVSVTEDSWTYSFTVKDVLSYTIQVQSYNNGGTITMEQVVNN